MSTPQYDKLCEEITDETVRRTFEALIGSAENNRLLTNAHVDAVYGPPPAELNHRQIERWYENHARQIRDMVEILRNDYHIPVCSTSGKAGRWLAGSQAEIDECLADCQSRRDSLDATITALRKAKVPPPAQMPRKAEAVQAALF